MKDRWGKRREKDNREREKKREIKMERGRERVEKEMDGETKPARKK